MDFFFLPEQVKKNEADLSLPRCEFVLSNIDNYFVTFT